MHKIAIIDDNISVIFKIEEVLDEIMKEQGMNYTIDTFDSGDKFCHSLNHRNIYDILFLDINLKDQNGIDIATRIREHDKLVKLVFISYETSQALRLFDTNPYNFLIKPLDKDKLKEVVLDIFDLLDNSQDYFEFKIRHSTYKVLMNDIMYFENLRRKIKIVTNNEEFLFYEKINDVEEMLSDHNNFLRIHQSYIINYDFVKVYHYDEMELLNGLILPISNKYRNILKKQILNL